MVTTFKPIQIADFTGGLNTTDPAAELPINQSPDSDNIILMDKGFKKRTGDTEFNSTAMNSGADVQGMHYVKLKGGNEFLIAISGAKVFKSDSLDGTMDEIDKAAGGTAPSAGQNNIYDFVTLNDLVVWFGTTAPQKWDGSTATNDYEDLDGSPPTADFAFVARNRCFAGKTSANKSTLYWSVLGDITDWSGTGSGNQDFDADDGDFLTAAMPLNNDIVLVFKQYSIHHLLVQSAPFPVKPLLRGAGIGAAGKRAVANIGGQVYFMSTEPRLYKTNGYTVELVDPQGRVDSLFDGLNKTRLAYTNLYYDPIEDLLHVIGTNGTGTSNDYDIIWDLKHNCWLRNTKGFDCNVTVRAQGYRFFGGHTDGKIYEKYQSGTYVDASESGSAINGYLYTPWITGTSNDTVVKPHSMTLNYKTQVQGEVAVSYGFNYNKNTNTFAINQEQTGGKWGIDTWDETFVWGGRSDAQKRNYIRGRGNNFQLKISNNTANEQYQVNSFSLLMKEQGVKEINNV